MRHGQERAPLYFSICSPVNIINPMDQTCLTFVHREIDGVRALGLYYRRCRIIISSGTDSDRVKLSFCVNNSSMEHHRNNNNWEKGGWNVYLPHLSSKGCAESDHQFSITLIYGIKILDRSYQLSERKLPHFSELYSNNWSYILIKLREKKLFFFETLFSKLLYELAIIAAKSAA